MAETFDVGAERLQRRSSVDIVNDGA